MKKILLVEDDDIRAKNLILLFNSEEFSVVHASTQSDAIKFICENKFDLFSIDISLPYGNGFMPFNELKETGNVPVIFLTASDYKYSIVTGLNIEADGYITKPFRLHELIARIKNIFRKTGSSSSIFEMCGLYVDMASCIVEKEKDSVNPQIILTVSGMEYRWGDNNA